MRPYNVVFVSFLCCRACRGEHRSPANLALHPPSGHGRALTKRPRVNTVRPYNVVFVSFLCCRVCRGEHRSPANLALHPPSGHGRARTKRPRANTVRPYNVLFGGLRLQNNAPQGNNNLAKRVELYYTDNAAIGGKALHNNGRRLAPLPAKGVRPCVLPLLFMSVARPSH